MKTSKIITVLFAFTIFIAGCTVENPEYDLSLSQKQITISAYVADTPETKTQRDESDGSVWWTPGDAISLFYGSGTAGGNRFVSTNTEPSKVTNFTGTIGVITGGADVSVEDTYFWGLYPYDAAASCDGSSVITTLPNTQVATPSTFASNLFPSLGRSQGLSMGFYNICGGVRFTVTKEGLKKVTLKAIGGEKLTGKARIGFENGVPKVLEITEGSDEITLTAPEGKCLEVGKYYYFITFPQALSQGIQMKFESYTEEGTYERRTSSLTIKRSIFGTLNNVDQNVVYAQKTGNIPIEDPNFKTYLVENYDTDSDGEISYEEASAVTSIDFNYSEKHIASVKGIEYFPNLERIMIVSHAWYPTPDWIVSKDESLDESLADLRAQLESIKSSIEYFPMEGILSFTANTKMKSICIEGALSLEGLDVSNCPELDTLMCVCSFTTTHATLDISHNTNLKCLSLYNCYFVGTLDLSHCPSLASVGSTSNFFSEINFGDTSNSNLKSLSICDGYPLESLSTANFPELVHLNVSYSLLTGGTDRTGYIASGRMKSLDVTKNTKLESLNCTGCNIEEPLDLSNCSSLKEVYAYYNEFEVFTLGNHPDLYLIYLAGCWHLKELDLSGCPALEWISTWSCDSLGPVDYSSCTHLKTLYLPPDGSILSSCTEIETYVGNMEYLQYFPHLKDYSWWHFSSIDLSANLELEKLSVGTTNCTTMDLSLLKNLKKLDVGGWSTFTVLDISHNMALTDVTFGGSEALQTLYVAEGQNIEGITVNRSDSKIHPNTNIVIVPQSGGGEGTGNDNWD